MNEMMPRSQFRTVLNSALWQFFLDAVRVTFREPAYALLFCRTIQRLRRDARRRAVLERQGVCVPPIVIFSITDECNLQCKNCYQQALHPASGKTVSDERIRKILVEAGDLGVSFFVLAGGEPFLRSRLLDITGEHPDMLFLVFTNGLLINEPEILKLKKQRNVILLVSLEGQEEETDARRGEGVHAHLEMLLPRLRREGIFFGISLTITSENFRKLTDRGYLQKLTESGCRFFLFLEYTPILKGTEGLVLTSDQRRMLMEFIVEFRNQFSALFIAVPGHEEAVGGCLAAGRGFIHISAQGDVEPCPFAPFSDISIATHSLKDALRSDFLGALRRYPEKLRISQGGCCLWKQREWVADLLKRSMADRDEGSVRTGRAGDETNRKVEEFVKDVERTA